jgi:3-oxoacyl-[acyl-carrier protein] reductase
MLTPISGKSVIVTGATKGIGKGIARVFAKHDANVLVVARTGSDAKASAEELNQLGTGDVSAFGADIGDWDAQQAMAAACSERYDGIDILCANAGIYPQTLIADMDPSEFDLVLNTNIKGTFLSVKACLPFMKEKDYGRIVLTSSITGPITGFPGWSHYGASKAAQLGFMRTACIETAKYNITMNAVLPGNIITEGLDGLGEDYLATMAASIPLKKLGVVEDIGYAALFLASQEANYITGQTIVVDGGQTLPESIEALE